jgi:hypothetical protein
VRARDGLHLCRVADAALSGSPERFPRITQTLLVAEADPDQRWALIVESLIAGLAAQVPPADPRS